MEPDRVFIDFHEENLTMMQVLTKVAELQKQYPEYEIFMDGDRFAIVGRRRKERWEGEGSPSVFTIRTTRTSGSPIAASSPAQAISRWHSI